MRPVAPTTRTRVARTPALVIDASGDRKRTRERVAGEEPLEIRVALGGEVLTTTATMRTPDSDFALAAGLLHAEGVIATRDDIERIRYCDDPGPPGADAHAAEQQFNVVTVDLARRPRRPLGQRTLMATASCGVCGSAEIDELCERIAPVDSPLELSAGVLTTLPDFLQVAQRVFAETGGLHAAGLFDAAGRLLALHEDIGRHNALDKLIGEQLLQGALPAKERVIVLSGRISFELVQKAAAAGVPVLAAVGAPSNLAVATADRLGLTLAGWVRDGRATLYTHAHRITGRPEPDGQPTESGEEPTATASRQQRTDGTPGNQKASASRDHGTAANPRAAYSRTYGATAGRPPGSTRSYATAGDRGPACSRPVDPGSPGSPGSPGPTERHTGAGSAPRTPTFEATA